MDRKNHNGFDPRYLWPHLAPLPWIPIPSVGWPQQFPVPPTSFTVGNDPNLTYVFANPAAATFTRQENMSQENTANPSAAGGSNPWTWPPSSNPRVSAADKPDASGTGGGAMVPGQRQPVGASDRLPTERALQQLSRQLDDAISFCSGCFRQHEEDVEKVAKYLDTECRNGLWRKLLESKFKESERDKHLFKNLQADLQWYVRQTREVAEADMTDHADDGEKKTKYENVVHEVRILELRVEEVVKHAEVAMDDLAECKRMVDEMVIMKEWSDKLGSGDQPRRTENEY